MIQGFQKRAISRQGGFVGVICRRWKSTESLTPTLLGIDVNGRVMTELHESMDSGFLKVYSLNWGG